MTPAPDYAEIAKKVNARLTERAKPGAMPEMVSANRVERLLDGTGCRIRHATLIREIAAKVAGEEGRREMKARLNDPEGRFPISIIDGGGIETALTMNQAEGLRNQLFTVTDAIHRHLQCVDEGGTKSVPGFRCHARGSVKQPDGTYLCRLHAKRAAKEPK